MRYLSTSLVAGLVLSLAGAVSAEPLRLHATAGAAHAVGGHQEHELGFGAVGFGAAELPLSRELGVQLELGGAWLSSANPPEDPTIQPEGSANAGGGGIGLRARPFASSYAGRPASAAGLWLSATGGALRTGGLTRATANAGLGFDFLYTGGKLGVGPMVGWLHVFQPDSELRPDDANIVYAGVHVMFDTAPAKKYVEGDRDHDGIKDSVDKCPDDPEDKDGFEDTDGCPDPDNDKDGILDKVDHCPDEPEDKDGFEDKDGCPDPDNDKDGILDKADKCPDEPEDKDGFEDEDGCPDPDNDKDGIPDVTDLCPNEPETKNGYADEDGCPDEEQVRVVGDKIVLDDKIHFGTNSAIIRPVSYPLLDHLVKLIKDHPEYIHIDVQGHTDERGPAWFNQKLSEDRARSVMEYMSSHGVDPKRLSSQGFGSTKPLVDQSSEHAWFLNRRVEFKVTREVKKISRSGGPSAAEGAKPESGAVKKDGDSK